jgi:hypothetical protein
MWTIREEPASDDFHTFVPSTCGRPFAADEQVSFDARRRASAFHPLNHWQNTLAELKHLASVALNVLVFVHICLCRKSLLSRPVLHNGLSDGDDTGNRFGTRDDPGELARRPAADG